MEGVRQVRGNLSIQLMYSNEELFFSESCVSCLFVKEIYHFYKKMLGKILLSFTGSLDMLTLPFMLCSHWKFCSQAETVHRHQVSLVLHVF